MQGCHSSRKPLKVIYISNKNHDEVNQERSERHKWEYIERIKNNLEDDYERKSQTAVMQQAHRVTKEMNTD